MPSLGPRAQVSGSRSATSGVCQTVLQPQHTVGNWMIRKKQVFFKHITPQSIPRSGLGALICKRQVCLWDPGPVPVHRHRALVLSSAGGCQSGLQQGSGFTIATLVTWKHPILTPKGLWVGVKAHSPGPHGHPEKGLRLLLLLKGSGSALSLLT